MKKHKREKIPMCLRKDCPYHGKVKNCFCVDWLECPFMYKKAGEK